MYIVSKSFFFTASISLFLALFVMYVLLVHKGIDQQKRTKYMVGFSVAWTMFNIIAL
jgi:hypothetical protein